MIGFLFAILFFVIGFFVFGKCNKNIYIATHKAKWRNERYYKEYLNWLNKKGGDIPLDEIKMNHEQRITNELNKTINK